MRRLALAAVIASIGLVPYAASAQTQVATPAPATVEQTDYLYPLVLAAGALAGVAAINVATYSVGTLPLSVGLAGASAAPIVSPAAAAASRIFVITSGVFGAWIASALYGK
jgi:hypothetical protein